MPVVRLIWSGAAPIAELPFTGSQRSWVPGLMADVDTTISPALLAVAGFRYADGVTLTAAQVAAPPPGVVANLAAIYQLDVAPYTRYQSNGTALVSLGSGGAQATGFDFGNVVGSANFTASGAAQQIGTLVFTAGDMNSLNRRLRIHYNIANTGGTTLFKQLTLRLGNAAGAVLFVAQLNAAALAARSVGEVFVDTVGAAGRLRSTQEPVTNSGSDTTLSAALDLTAAITMAVCLEAAGAVNETVVCRQCHVFLE